MYFQREEIYVNHDKSVSDSNSGAHLTGDDTMKVKNFCFPKDYQGIMPDQETLTGSLTEEGSLLICTNKLKGDLNQSIRRRCAVGCAAQFYAEDNHDFVEPDGLEMELLYLKRSYQSCNDKMQNT